MIAAHDKNLSVLRQQFETKDTTAHDTSLILYRRLSDINSKAVKWLWKGRIARGKISIIAGNPSLGKSQLTANLASTVTTGNTWPLDHIPCEKGSVIFLSAEDDAEDTIRPRLEAAEADLTRVFIIDAIQNNTSERRQFNLKTDLSRLETMLKNINDDVSLLIIDPITAYLGETNSYNNADVRALLAPLGDFAATHNIAIVGISHLNKGGNNEALMRVSGSLAFVAAARAAFLVAQDDIDENKRLFLPLKNNLYNNPTGLAFTIQPYHLENGIETSHIVWSDETILKTANDIMAPQEDRSALDEAEEFLCDLLANGSKPVKEIQRDADNAGHAWATVKRAKNKLGIIPRKCGMDKGWEWALPEKELNDTEDTHQ